MPGQLFPQSETLLTRQVWWPSHCISDGQSEEDSLSAHNQCSENQAASACSGCAFIQPNTGGNIEGKIYLHQIQTDAAVPACQTAEYCVLLSPSIRYCFGGSRDNLSYPGGCVQVMPSFRRGLSIVDFGAFGGARSKLPRQ